MTYPQPAAPYAASYPPAPPPPAPPRKPWALIVGVAAVAAAAGAGIATAVLTIGDETEPGAAETAQSAVFEQAVASCSASSGAEVADDGRTLIVLVGGESSSGLDGSTFACLAGRLKMPLAVRSHIESTRALDGQQTDSWPGYTARWTFHPDNGLELTIRTA